MVREDYIDGKWVIVRPNYDGERFICRVGVKVEISLEEEERFRDVWFPATIVEDLGNDRFLVEYKELQRVSVDRLHIRPLRPDFPHQEIHLLKKVEAFYDFGWWSGVVTKELADGRYVVYFKHTNKVKEFSRSELRTLLKWHWEKEIWFIPYEDAGRGWGRGSGSSSSSCSDSSVDLQDSSAQIVNGTSNSVEKSLGSVSEVSNQNGDGGVKKLSSIRGAELTSQKEKSNTPTKGKRGRSTFVSNIECEERESFEQITGKTLSVNFDTPPSITVGNDKKPSFEKRSSFWETSKSMEAFRLFPQNPHFRPLDKINEVQRHAIHRMVDFLGVFEDMCRLRHDQPRSEIEDQLQTLLELETHGFDVGSLRSRLMEMLSWKDKREALETGSKNPEDNLEIERVKVQELNTDIVLIDSQINELRDKRQRFVKENEESTLNIVAWEKEVEDIEEAKCECDRKFYELATAPF